MSLNHENLVELFENTVHEYPNSPAIKDCNDTLTYKELYQLAAKVAMVLHDQKVREGEQIVCISKKDNYSIICFWGILLSGATPVMLDHDDGLHTNEEKVKVVSPGILIADKNSLVSSPILTSGVVLDFEEMIGNGIQGEGLPLFSRKTIPELCYVLLTSGTSGVPKAVQISHQNILHYTYAIYERMGKPEQVVAAHVTTFSADLGLTNLLLALISGGMLRILNKEESTDPEIFNHILRADQISVLKMTPSHLLSVTSGKTEPYQEQIRNLILGGEKLSWTTVEKLFSMNICTHLYNHYGPTETTVGAFAYKVERDSPHFHKTSSVPIGTPLGEGAFFLENEQDQIGELFIGGPGVSVGYLENEDENKKRFVFKKTDKSMKRYFRTGDLCKRLDDGALEFLHRTDRQVKVRGYRIELGEIEGVFASHADIENVVICLSDNADHPAVEAFVKVVEGKELSQSTLRAWLSKLLPGYKIPSVIYFYKETPYNANGKIDLKALKKVFSRNTEVSSSPSESVSQHSWAIDVAQVWKNVLGIDEVLDTDNFFETGGDSLLAIQMIGRLQRYGYKVHIGHLNAHPVFSEFLLLKPEMSLNDQAGIQVTDKNYTYSQNGFLTQKRFDLNKYCQSILLEVEGKVQIREMSMALNYILKSHLQLITPISKAKEDRDINKVHSDTNVTVTILGKDEAKVTQIQRIASNIQKQISLENGELFKAHIFVDPTGKDYIFMTCHHLVIDVISWNIILDEFLEYYENLLDQKLPVVAAENAVNLFYSKKLEDTCIKRPLAPFIQKLFKLPEGPSQQNTKHETQKVYSLVIPDEIANVLKYMDDHMDANMLSSFLLSSFGQAVLDEFNIPELSVDIEFHGRPQHLELPDLSRSVAWWATTMPVNLQTNNCDPFNCRDLLKARGEQANMINLSKDDYPERYNDYPDVRFNYLGHFPDEFKNSYISMKPSRFNPGPTRSGDAQKEYQLFFTSRFIGSVLLADIQYQANRFDKQVIDNIIERFFKTLKEALRKENYNVGSAQLVKRDGNTSSVGQPLYNPGFYNLSDKASGKKSVFLTGATGFLGIQILRELLRDPQVNIFCLVRGNDQMHAEDRLEENYAYYFDSLPLKSRRRITVVKGDLKFSDFGMTATKYDMLANEIDLIIHAAADINLLKNYSELMNVNITTINHIIAFAGTGKNKQINYVSTLAVSGCLPGGGRVTFAEKDFDYGQEFVSDYEKTKFEAEQIVREFFNRGGSGRIYRSGHIAADSVNGKFQHNIHQNRVFQVIKGMMLLKQVPDLYQECVSFSYVDVVAGAIANFSLDKIESDMECLHLENPQYISFKGIAKMLNEMGYGIEVVDIATFNSSVTNFKGVQKDQETVNLFSLWVQRSINSPRNVSYALADSLDTIACAGIYFPESTYSWFTSMINEGIKTGYFNSIKKYERKLVLTHS